MGIIRRIEDLPRLRDQRNRHLRTQRMNKQTGLILLFIGGAIVIAGLLIYFFHDKLHWLGRLPGDIRIEKENVRIYIPITTMLLLSGLFSLIIYLVRRFL